MSHQDDNNNEKDEKDEQVVLVIGSCGLDRLLTIPEFPTDPDAKIRSSNYLEMGGGNAANTATAMARLASAKCFRHQSERENNIKIKLLTKIGQDDIGKWIITDLQRSKVDTTSPLFQIAKSDNGITTTSWTTVLVSQAQQSRCCIHTPGTCGELSVEEDWNNLSTDDLDRVFENVVHIHSDCRHTRVALELMRHGRFQRGIPSLSVDAEKDRKMGSYQDELLQHANLLFTNALQLQEYFQNYIAKHDGDKTSVATTINDENLLYSPKIMSVLAESIEPSAFYLKWFAKDYNYQVKKQVIITKGSLGSLHIQPKQQDQDATMATNTNTDKKQDNLGKETTANSTINNYNLNFKRHATEDDTLVVLECEKNAEEPSSESGTDSNQQQQCFRIQPMGVLKNIQDKIVDTTGAGDAFIGGYLMAMLFLSSAGDGANKMQQDRKLALQFGTWTSGKKLQGPGAQGTLPTGKQVDQELGTSLEEVKDTLQNLVGNFGAI